MAERYILVADDSEAIRAVLSQFLEALNYKVVIAADGQAALDTFKAQRPDLVISDLQMPRLDGLALLKAIKGIDPDAQVIILTGHATLETAVEALRLGAYDYLFKPIEDMEVFRRLVERTLKHAVLIKENKRLLAELREANQKLETKVAERTRELQAANVALREADKLKNDFVMVVSHELRTPLAVILLEVQLLVQKAPALRPEKIAEIYATLAANARRMQMHIENLLDFSLIERGKLELKYQPCSIGQIIREVADLYAARAAEKQLRFVAENPAAAPLAVNADGPRLRSALIHVVDNAVKFTPPGGSVIIGAHGATTLPATNIPAVAIVVRDTGVGIAPDRQQALFAAFTQADMTTTRRYGGMGLGLVLADRIIAAHHGQITFKSEPGQGSLFALWIPINN